MGGGEDKEMEGDWGVGSVYRYRDAEGMGWGWGGWRLKQ